MVPVGDPAFDDAEDDCIIGIHPEMQDFIVPDSEGEAFTFLRPTVSLSERHTKQ